MTDWTARHVFAPPDMAAPHSLPLASDDRWKPLVRHHRADRPRTGTFNAGWARIDWIESALIVDFVFATTSRARNRARQLNERTHELGEVGELFLQCVGANHYIEIHVTPENQRLQLLWTREWLEAVRSGKATLEEFVISNPHWVHSITAIAPSYWSARTIVPADIVLGQGRSAFDCGTELIASVCRYDISDGPTPVLSSTADYQGRPFHEREAWDRVILSR